MKFRFFARTSLIAAILAIFHPNLIAAGTDFPGERWLLDSGWKFYLGNPWGDVVSLAKAGDNRGPARSDFSDVDWQSVNLPHDWALELPLTATPITITASNQWGRVSRQTTLPGIAGR